MRSHRGGRAAIVAALVLSFGAGSHLSAGRTLAVPPTATSLHFYNLYPTVVVNTQYVIQVYTAQTVDGGTIEVKIDGSTLDTKAVAVGGFTEFPWTPNTKKAYTVQAFYSGTAAFAASQTNQESITVIPPLPTSVVVTGTPNPVQRNADIVLTTTITPNPGAGNVEWWDATTESQKVATTAVDPATGQATWTTSFATQGQKSIFAKWVGNANWSPRTSDDFFHPNVLGDGITVTVTIPGTPLLAGDVTANVTLSPNPGTGVLEWAMCQFCQETEVAVDADGTTSIDLGTFTNVTSYTVYVRYPQNGNWAEATGQGTFEIWNPTTTGLVTDRTTAYVGELPVKLTATVTMPALSAFDSAQGTVTFLDDVGGSVVELGPVTINPYTRQAVFSSSNLRVGTHTITAEYGGMQWFRGSTSSPVTVVVGSDTAVHATFAPSLATFYPVKDGFKDIVKLGGVLSEKATVTIRAYNSAGTLKRTWSLGTRNPSAYSVAWDGKTAAGSALPAGSYTIKASFKDVKGHTRVISGKTAISLRQVVWKSVSVLRYADTGTYYVGEFGGNIYYSPDYARGRILDSGEMIRDCEDCGFAAGNFVFTVVSTNALAYRNLFLEFRGHDFTDREHPGSHALVDPRTGDLALINGNYPIADPDVHWGIPFTSAFIDANHHVSAWIYMEQRWGDAYDLNWLKLTYQYAVWK